MVQTLIFEENYIEEGKKKKLPPSLTNLEQPNIWVWICVTEIKIQVLVGKSTSLFICCWFHIWLSLCDTSLVMYCLCTSDIFSVTLQVVITQMNGADHPSESIHVLHVGKMRIKLCKGKTTIAKEYYSTSMQVLWITFIYLFI